MRRTWLRSLTFCVGIGFAILISGLSVRYPSRALLAKKAGTPAPSQPASSAPLQTYRNLGKAYYEQGKYAEATLQFQKVIASGRALATDYMNLGLSLMQSNKMNLALGALTTAKQMAPRLVAVDYNRAILYKRELRYPLAEAALKRVIAADPSSPSAWFNLGTVYFAEHKWDLALSAHERVNEMGFAKGQNFYVASLFHTFTILVRMGRRREARKILKLHQEVSGKVPGISLQTTALEAGKYGAIIVPTSRPVAVAAWSTRKGITFQPFQIQANTAVPGVERLQVTRSSSEIKVKAYSPELARQRLLSLFGSSLAFGDYDGDGHPDLYVSNPDGKDHLLHNNADGSLLDVTVNAGLAVSGRSLAATFADYDNSGHPSLFVAGLGGVRLYKNNGNGTFTDVTQKSGLPYNPNVIASHALLFDADNDGLLDLVVTQYVDLAHPPERSAFRLPDDFTSGTVHFYHNNGNGTFSDVTASSELRNLHGRFRDVVFADFNGDGYADLVFFRDDGLPLLFLNEGQDKFVNRTRAAGAAFSQATAFDGAVADFDHDGRFDLALWSRKGYEVLRNTGDARFAPFPGLPTVKPPAGLLAFRGIVADLNGDSFDDLLLADANGRLHFIANRMGRFVEAPLHLPLYDAEQIGALRAAWLRKPGELDLVGTTGKRRLVAWSKRGHPSHWLEIKMKGFKSNKQGVGAVVEIKKGNFYDKILATGGALRVYTGDLNRLDVVRVTWPNAVVQNRLNVSTDALVEFRESSRLASSCPLLYVWNGKHFEFFTDILGVGPLGELGPDGTRIKPYPRALAHLPHALPEHEGNYQFQLTDELREVDYFDQLRLLAVDHPKDENIYADEIYSASPSPPKLYAVRHEETPLFAVNQRGQNVLPLIRKADGRYAGGFRQERIPGVAEQHSLTLDLGRLRGASHVTLWLTGWVYWTDSNGSRAVMSNPNMRLISPYLQVRNKQGHWVTVIPDIGLPSGTNRTLRVDLTGKFLSSDHHIRIVTSLCVYWDRIFFTTSDSTIKASAELSPDFANLHYRGFSTPSSDPHHLRPDDFEYTALMKRAPWDPMVGNYTRYGSVQGLLAKADDQLVVMATGDELTVRFKASALPPLRPGWKRDFFLEATGYAKDGEPNTADSKTVGPLPFRAMANYPPRPLDHMPASQSYKAYIRQYQTRPGYKLIPPLTPPVQ